MARVNWLVYAFEVLNHGAQWNDIPGIYIFCGLSPQNRWVPLYIGQADSLRNRIPQHEQWNPAARLGATHVHARVVEQEGTRLLIEQELIREYQPSLNVQHK